MTSNFSKEAASKTIVSKTVQHPITLLSAAIGILSGLSAALFGGWPLTMISIAGLLTSILSWFVNFKLRREVFANEYFKELKRQLEKKNEQLMQSIERALSSDRIIKTSGAFGKQGSNQYKKIQDKFQTLNRILEQKLNPGELTHERFLGVAEQVYFSVLDNLQNVSTILESTSSIDVDYITERLVELGGKGDLETADVEEMKTLNERMALRDNQFKKVNELLTLNEQAMTKLDQTSSSLASVQTTAGRSSTNFEDALTELEEIATSAEKYSVR